MKGFVIAFVLALVAFSALFLLLDYVSLALQGLSLVFGG